MFYENLFGDKLPVIASKFQNHNTQLNLQKVYEMV